MELVSAEEGRAEQFPVGMRVLAVDDSPICLEKLRDLLLLCKYHVTKTTESKEALEMLREKRDMFDLVITDADMPDTDAFKLLETGLEMGLPVIMMSAHCDHVSVTRGITHGACDYLIKPVGLKDLQYVWQHVVRKNISKYAKNIAPSESRLLPSVSNNQKDKVDDSNREKKEGEGNEHSVQEQRPLKKRHRVVWTTELHKKFVTAFEQLGVCKAVPKKINELMNVEGLTREDVASHLQIFRVTNNLYARRQQNMAPDAFGTKDLSYFPKAQPTTTPLEPLLFPESNISEVTKKDPSCRLPITIEPFSHGGASRRHRFFLPLLLAAAIALSTYLWFFVSL